MGRGLFLGMIFWAVAGIAAPTRAQFTLRFKEIRAHASALTGCYGTASYHYVLPSIETLRAHQENIKKVVDQYDLEGFAWSANADPEHAGRILVMDLADGQVHSAAKMAASDDDRGLVICQCKQPHLKYCTTMALPALGHPFYSTGVTVFPQP